MACKAASACVRACRNSSAFPCPIALASGSMNGRQTGRQHQAEDYASPSLPNGCQFRFRCRKIAPFPPPLESVAMTEHRLIAFRGKVEPAWIDYNGHMNVGYYVVAFDKGTDGLLDRLGLGEA